MKRHWILRGLKIWVFVAVAATVFSFVVMGLWNRLVPAIFGLRAITFWQALGLLILSKILFGGFHGRHGMKGDFRARLTRRWEDMTPEEREKFRSRGISPASGCCGTSKSSPDAPPASTVNE